MSEYTLWTCPRDEWNTMLDEIMQDIGRGEVSAIVEEALKQFRDEFERRLNMTPIEKAAAEIAKAIEEGKYDYQEGEEFAANMAAHFRRVLSEEVPEKKPASSIYKNVDKWYRLGYNKARRDFLGKEE